MLRRNPEHPSTCFKLLLTVLRYDGMWPADKRAASVLSYKLYNFYSAFMRYFFIHLYTLAEIVYLIFIVKDLTVRMVKKLISKFDLIFFFF